ncbi:aminotransferase class V-fold PLP-dependent enzyme [Solihabitans fulvus]|uniref:Aminotransferase class V-fold PLP-dependent enzyme n=1 Tax=Solihabitans fulvus TaxID=1892852 RepID=A0A5B2XFI4_9PSEU|nr:aminotransferase class V-fold PLP-dependent enzyme [Solihabitans fulvus]
MFSLDPEVAHLNNGSFGAVPRQVQRAQDLLRAEMDRNPMRFFTRGLPARIADARRQVADFLGAAPGLTALLPNVTAATSVALGTIDLGPGEEVLVTDHGYAAVTSACARRCREAGATLTEVSIPFAATDDEVTAAMLGAVGPRTRLAVVDHVTSHTARTLPVRRLCAELARAGVAVLVDAAHAPGMLPEPVAGTGADFWIGNLHKWAFSPRSVAALVVAPRWRSSVRPLALSYEDSMGFPAAVEWQGTLDYTALLAAPAGLAMLAELGLPAMRRHNSALAAYGQRVVAEALDLDPAGLPGEEALAMRVIPLPVAAAPDEASAVALRERIADELRCEVALNFWRGRPLLRLSAQVYNDEADFDRLAAGLPGLLR